MADATMDPRMVAAYYFLQRSGARQVQLRYSDDELPVVWLAAVGYNEERWEAAAALTPLQAVLRLCEQVCDGARCTHCNRPTGFEPASLDAMPLDSVVCWYQYDPGAQRYIRACA